MESALKVGDARTVVGKVPTNRPARDEDHRTCSITGSKTIRRDRENRA
jgi:hypothetical protein